MIRSVQFAFIGLLLVGCETSFIGTDPLKSFKVVFEAVIPKLNQLSDEVREIPSEPKTWQKWQSKWVDAKYDVKKTDSLVSPFTATIAATAIHSKSPEFPTEAEARAATEFQVDRRSPCEYEYAFQEGKWILKSARTYSNDFGWRTLEIEELSPEELKEVAVFLKALAP